MPNSKQQSQPIKAGYLLNRVLLKFKDRPNKQNKGKLLYQNLSAVVLVGKQLWMASDETATLECLTQLDSFTFGNHQTLELEDFLDRFVGRDVNNQVREVDIEGLSYDDQYLWAIGSHSTKRKAISNKGVNPAILKDEELGHITCERSRYLLARIPLVNGKLCQSHADLTAAVLDKTEDGNLLISALKQDSYLAPFFTRTPPQEEVLPGKDNGFDIEGLAVQKNRILIGLRGPVLRGIAVFLEIMVKEAEPGLLKLKRIGSDGKRYKKHFVDLDGLGIRDLNLDGEDLFILAGPTMDLDGTFRIFRLNNVFQLPENSLSTQEDGKLEVLFDIPYSRKTDHAEGFTLFTGLNQSSCALVVYDSPAEERKVKSNDVLADVFTLNSHPTEQP